MADEEWSDEEWSDDGWSYGEGYDDERMWSDDERMTPDERQLFRAAKTGVVEEVRRLLAAGVDVNAEDQHGNRALSMAAGGRHVDVVVIVELLLKNGADVRAVTNNGLTALHRAASGHLDVVKLLLKKGADVNAKNGGHTALHLAVVDDRPDVVKLLLKKGADVHARDKWGYTALHYGALDKCRLRIVKLLVEKGAYVNATNEMGDTPLHKALDRCQNEVAYFLLKRGAVAVIVNYSGIRPLDAAVKPRYGEPDVDLICKMLLPSSALVHLAQDGLEAHEKRQKRIAAGLKRAMESPSMTSPFLFLSDLADTLAGIDASGCARGTGAMLVALLRQLDAFAEGAGDGAVEAHRAPERPVSEGLGEAYEARRRRHGLVLGRAVQSGDFLSELAEGLAGVNLFASDLVAPRKLVAAALKLDALSEAELSELREENETLREQNRALVAELEEVRGRTGARAGAEGRGGRPSRPTAATLAGTGARQRGAPKRRRRGGA